MRCPLYRTVGARRFPALLKRSTVVGLAVNFVTFAFHSRTLNALIYDAPNIYSVHSALESKCTEYSFGVFLRVAPLERPLEKPGDVLHYDHGGERNHNRCGRREVVHFRINNDRNSRQNAEQE